MDRLSAQEASQVAMLCEMLGFGRDDKQAAAMFVACGKDAQSAADALLSGQVAVPLSPPPSLMEPEPESDDSFEPEPEPDDSFEPEPEPASGDDADPESEELATPESEPFEQDGGAPCARNQQEADAEAAKLAGGLLADIKPLAEIIAKISAKEEEIANALAVYRVAAALRKHEEFRPAIDKLQVELNTLWESKQELLPYRLELRKPKRPPSPDRQPTQNRTRHYWPAPTDDYDADSESEELDLFLRRRFLKFPFENSQAFRDWVPCSSCGKTHSCNYGKDDTRIIMGRDALTEEGPEELGCADAPLCAVCKHHHEKGTRCTVCGHLGSVKSSDELAKSSHGVFYKPSAPLQPAIAAVYPNPCCGCAGLRSPSSGTSSARRVPQALRSCRSLDLMRSSARPCSVRATGMCSARRSACCVARPQSR